MSKAVGRGGHKKVKKEKKEVPLKTAEERKLEVDYIKGVLLQYQIDDSYAPIAELFAIMKQFIETEPEPGSKGETIRGEIDFPECPPYGRVIKYQFFQKKMHKSTCDLIMKGSQDLSKFVERSKLGLPEPMKMPRAESIKGLSKDHSQTNNTEKFKSAEKEIDDAPELLDVSKPNPATPFKVPDYTELLQKKIEDLKQTALDRNIPLTEEEIKQFADNFVPSVDQLQTAFDRECEKLTQTNSNKQ